MVQPRPSFFATLITIVMGGVLLRALQAVFSFEVEQFWDKTIKASATPWLATIANLLPGFWGGVAATLVLLFAFEMFFAWRRHRSEEVAITKLALTFDNELQSATAGIQSGVMSYYWYHVPSTAVDFEKRQLSVGPGHVIVFMALQFPARTNYYRARVIGGGVPCEVLSAHPSGPVVRANGDLRGRTIEIWFSGKPIPLD